MIEAILARETSCVKHETKKLGNDTRDLIGYAKEFVSVIALALLGISMGPSIKSYHLSAAAQELSGELQQLLTAANLI